MIENSSSYIIAGSINPCTLRQNLHEDYAGLFAPTSTPTSCKGIDLKTAKRAKIMRYQARQTRTSLLQKSRQDFKRVPVDMRNK